MQDSEYVGDTFQDEENRAALLLYKDRDDDALLMVSKRGIAARDNFILGSLCDKRLFRPSLPVDMLSNCKRSH